MKRSTSSRKEEMLDTGPTKQYFKDATPEEALSMYNWILAAMEVRGPIAVPGVRKRRSDAGKERGVKPEEAFAAGQRVSNGQPSLTGLPDEDQKS